MKEENGGMKFGWICVQSVELNCNFKESGPSHGNWRDGIASRAKVVTVLLEPIGS